METSQHSCVIELWCENEYSVFVKMAHGISLTDYEQLLLNPQLGPLPTRWSWELRVLLRNKDGVESTKINSTKFVQDSTIKYQRHSNHEENFASSKDPSSFILNTLNLRVPEILSCNCGI